jgi:hypothetical protein
MGTYNISKRGGKGVNKICVPYVNAVYGPVRLTIKKTIESIIVASVRSAWLMELIMGYPAGLEQGIE